MRSIFNLEVKVRDYVILESIVQNNVEIERDVNHRIQVRWLKWSKATGVLYDSEVLLKLRGKFYSTSVRLAMLYGR
jgi:hypothetical protein